MRKLLFLSSGARETVEKIEVLISEDTPIEIGDVYGEDLEKLDLYQGVLIGAHVDQRRLASRKDRIAAYLERGGTIIANGHVAYPFLPQMTQFHPIPHYRLEDLEVRRHDAHPIWEGVSVDDLTRRRGVSGFYARGWHAPPSGAEIIHTIGKAERPIDFIYGVGMGRVLFHGGNDLWSFADRNTSAARLAPQLLEWAFSREASS
jgi:hypothetical protein